MIHAVLMFVVLSAIGD